MPLTAPYTRRMHADPNAVASAISPAQALRRQRDGAVLIDVRDAAERSLGMPAGAFGLALDELVAAAPRRWPDRRCELLTLCASGRRSMRAVQLLRQLGYARVASVDGGFVRWQAEGLPVSGIARGSERYGRQMRLPQVGAAGQARLAAASVVLVGAGGLGSPVALYLAAAGVGRLTVIDDDVVERGNLHRQILHTDARIGLAKVESARAALAALNPEVRVDVYSGRLQGGNVDAWLTGHDVVVDGADNFPTRYLLAAASQRLRLPLVYGAVERFGGQVSVFDPGRADAPCYRCLYPYPPAADDVPSCAEAGVLGVLPGLIGLIQATETLKLLLGIGEPLVGRLLSVDALGMHFAEMRLPRNPTCPGCGNDTPPGETVAGAGGHGT